MPPRNPGFLQTFNLNFGGPFDRAATVSSRPSNLWVVDEGAREAVEQLSRDIGMAPLNGGPLARAGASEEFGKMLVAIVADAGEGLLLYRFATPENL